MKQVTATILKGQCEDTRDGPLREARHATSAQWMLAVTDLEEFRNEIQSWTPLFSYIYIYIFQALCPREEGEVASSRSGDICLLS